MKLFRILPLVFGSAAAGILSWSPAHALDFNFSINGPSNSTVDGIIYGLSNGTNVQASSVKVTSATGFSIATPLTFNGGGTFTVAGNTITSALYSGASGLYSLYINQNGFNGLTLTTPGNPPTISQSLTNTSGLAGVTYTPVPFDGNGASLSGGAILLALFLTMKKGRNIIASKTGIANPLTTTVS